MEFPGAVKYPRGQVGPAIQLPLMISLLGFAQAVQKVGDPLHDKQEGSQASKMKELVS